MLPVALMPLAVRTSLPRAAVRLRICVRRSQLFEDSFQQLPKVEAPRIFGRLLVTFIGEESLDAGGVAREWYVLMLRAMFNPSYSLFQPAADKRSTFQPSRLSALDRQHLQLFRFAGRFAGKALHDGYLLDAYLTRSFYKHMLGVRPSYHDLESVDPKYYSSLCWMLENDVTGVLDHLSLTAEQNDLGVQREVELKAGGREVNVGDENKRRYVELMAQHLLTDVIRPQIDAFLEGFHELTAPQHVALLCDSELELLMCGLADVDIADLRAHTQYEGYKESDEVVQWFWRVVEQLEDGQKAQLVQLVTSTSRVPIGGFAALRGMHDATQPFKMHRASGQNRLPAAHTCFNQLELPGYSSMRKLEEMLLLALREGGEGFAFR